MYAVYKVDRELSDATADCSHAVYIADDYHDSLSHFPATTTLVGLRVLSDIRPTFAGTVAGLILSVQSNQFVQSR